MIGYKQLDGLSVKLQPCAYFLLRVIAGLMFMTHGYSKLFGESPQPLLGGMGIFGIDVGLNMLFVAGVIEFFGGLLIVVGLLTRSAAALSALLMVMAYTHAHLAWPPLANRGELAILYFVVLLVIAAYGSGKWALDNCWCKWDSKRKKK